MDFPDLLLERDPGDRELTRMLAEAFAVTPETVQIIDGIEHLHGSVRPETTLLVERRHVRGEAALHLQFALLHPDSERAVQARGAVGVIQQLAKQLGATIITDDGGLDPSGYLIVRPDGMVEPTVLDDDRFDEDRYVSLMASKSLPSLEGGDMKQAQPVAPVVHKP